MEKAKEKKSLERLDGTRKHGVESAMSILDGSVAGSGPIGDDFLSNVNYKGSSYPESTIDFKSSSVNA
jgi:hypothetical protein